MHLYFPSKKTYSVWFISVLNYGDTENVLINHLLLVIPMSYPCHYTNLCSHKPHKHARPHTHTHTHTRLVEQQCESVCSSYPWLNPTVSANSTVEYSAVCGAQPPSHTLTGLSVQRGRSLKLTQDLHNKHIRCTHTHTHTSVQKCLGLARFFKLIESDSKDIYVKKSFSWFIWTYSKKNPDFFYY